MNHISYLKRIRFLHNLLLLCAVTLAVFDSIMGGIAALAFAFIIVWRYHRCPKCSEGLDTLLPLNGESCCPFCGCFLKDGTGPEEEAEPKAGAGAEPKPEAEPESKAEAEA